MPPPLVMHAHIDTHARTHRHSCACVHAHTQAEETLPKGGQVRSWEMRQGGWGAYQHTCQYNTHMHRHLHRGPLQTHSTAWTVLSENATVLFSNRVPESPKRLQENSHIWNANFNKQHIWERERWESCSKKTIFSIKIVKVVDSAIQPVGYMTEDSIHNSTCVHTCTIPKEMCLQA